MTALVHCYGCPTPAQCVSTGICVWHKRPMQTVEVKPTMSVYEVTLTLPLDDMEDLRDRMADVSCWFDGYLAANAEAPEYLRHATDSLRSYNMKLTSLIEPVREELFRAAKAQRDR